MAEVVGRFGLQDDQGRRSRQRASVARWPTQMSKTARRPKIHWFYWRASSGFCSEQGPRTGERCSEASKVLIPAGPAGLGVIRWSQNGGALVYSGWERVVQVDSVGHSLSVTNQKQVNIITIHKETKLFIGKKETKYYYYHKETKHYYYEFLKQSSERTLYY
jgi:hypothetical protein